MHLTLIAGARPNFMKIAPIIRAVEAAQREGRDIRYRLVHTGQHYDRNMSAQFFEQLGIPAPHINLEAGGGSQAEQTAAIMIGFERYLMQHPTNLVVVVGDVTSTLACSIVAKKLHTPVAHVEGGIRSGDMTMPEEINRIVTDSITDYFFTTSETANLNLQRSGVPKDRIFFVGNTMIDTLLYNLPRLQKPALGEALSLQEKGYIVLTLHRPANVDNASNLEALLSEIIHHSKGLPVIFPVHPRTAKTMEGIKEMSPSLLGESPGGDIRRTQTRQVSSPGTEDIPIGEMSPSPSGQMTTPRLHNLHLCEPMGYLEFIYLVRHAKAVITDSGGITEETTVLGVPCMTLRDSTERPETVSMGTNMLLGTDPATIGPALERLQNGQWQKGTIPPLWDGRAAERIVSHILTIHAQS